MSEAITRPIYWQISGTWLMYFMLLPTLAIFGYGLYMRFRLWRLGKPTLRTDQPLRRLERVFTYVFGHKRLLQERPAGVMHAFMYGSMLLLLIGTIVVALEADFGLPIMRGWFYLVFQSLVLDLAGALGLVGLGIALLRRFVLKIPRLQHNRPHARKDSSDSITLAAFILMFAQGFALEAIRIAGTPRPWDAWSPVGYLLARPLMGLDSAVLVGAYQVVWWFHMVTVFAWIAYIPYSKMLHLFTSAASVYFSDLRPAGAAITDPIDFETADRFGRSALTDFTWKDLLDLDACTACGRCQAVCPAYASGEPLSPRSLILDLRDYMREHGPKLLSGVDSASLPPLVGAAAAEDALWACTTCRACMEACPVHIEHVPKIVGMRQHLIMEQGSVPDTLQEALRSMEDRGHTFKGANAGRLDWCEGLGIPLAADVEQVDLLYWVGCVATFDPRGQRIARAFAQLLQIAGVPCAILGPEECCTGDPARRSGNEFLFDAVTRQNIETLQRYRPRRIVTTCPHCFNSIGQEYRRLGGEFEVVHHTQLLKELVDGGRLQVRAGVKSATFHDPCYLGRWNDEYAAPRAVLDAAVANRKEMEHNRSSATCCGAGGGHAWMEGGGAGPRTNQRRAAEAVATGAEVVATGCPFCMQMMEDGIRTTAGDGGPQVLDVAELLLTALE
ncbi:MAG TPA: (Fe-S)-binding protein [Symbiobacteriaceae bacterium]|nr:(Fe-S)-binding protein [Symbiobacteriaceae bacterium]